MKTHIKNKFVRIYTILNGYKNINMKSFYNTLKLFLHLTPLILASSSAMDMTNLGFGIHHVEASLSAY